MKHIATHLLFEKEQRLLEICRAHLGPFWVNITLVRISEAEPLRVRNVNVTMKQDALGECKEFLWQIYGRDPTDQELTKMWRAIKHLILEEPT